MGWARSRGCCALQYSKKHGKKEKAQADWTSTQERRGHGIPKMDQYNHGARFMNPAMPILIVDDYPTMRQTIADVMRRFGFNNISFAEDGQMAWEMMQSQSYGLVLLDWSMPRMSGLELLKRIRSSDGEIAAVPVLAITAEAEERHIVEAVRHGVSDYIVKPFTPATLERKVQAIFRRQEPCPSGLFRPAGKR
jgi:two-component system, chemotaxis family, chemotaxis protein CheY